MPEFMKPTPFTRRILKVSSKFLKSFTELRNRFVGTFCSSEPPTIMPSFTCHHFSSPAGISQPARVLPSNRENGAAFARESAARKRRRRFMESVFEIKDDHPRQPRHHDQLHPLMLGMRQIGIAARAVVEGHDEAVREAVIEAFRAVVGTVLHREESWNPPDHRTHFREAFVDLVRSDLRVELEHAVVSDHG